MRTLAITILILATAPAFAQQIEHAPTVDQCQADQRLWLHRMEDTNDKLNDVTAYTLLGWSKEMQACDAVDHANSFLYLNTKAEIWAEKYKRLADFVDRHNLWEKFIEEDAAGQR
jgi:hypothetical protein